MNNTLKDNYFLELFLEFYRELLEVQEKCVVKKELPEKEIEKLHKQLKDLLEKQAFKVSMTAGSFIYDCYRELQYALCGLADEQMLYLDWSGKTWWKDHLLEREFFDTHNAGEQIFANIDAALSNQSNYRQSVLVAYLYFLSLGFLGKYNMRKDAADVIQKYKQDLFFQLHQTDPVKTYQVENLFNDTLLYTIQNSLVYESTRAKKLLKIGAIAFGIYMIISHFTWGLYVYPITSKAEQISENIRLINYKK